MKFAKQIQRKLKSWWNRNWQIRDRLSRAWRWPLHSRMRAITTLIVIVVLAITWPKITGDGTSTTSSTDAAAAASSALAAADSAGLSAPQLANASQVAPESAAAPASSVAPTSSTASASPIAAPTAAATSPGVAPIGPATVPPLTKKPPAPSLLPAAADFLTPQAVAAKYLQVWCYQPVNQPANTNIANTAGWVTAAGWADDKSRAVTQTAWASTQKSGLTSVCGPATVIPLDEAPNSTTLQWVQISARQAFVNPAGVIVGQQTINQTRRILQAPDHRWLVDMQVQAG